MIHSPFGSLARYKDMLRVELLTKADRIASDEDVRRCLGTQQIASLSQVHGGDCVIVDAPQDRALRADAMATDVVSLTLAIRAADCQTFVVFGPRERCIAVVHAGWKGLLAGVLGNTVETLQKTWRCDPQTLLVGAGPSLCMQCAEFTDPARELPGIESRFFSGRCADLRGIADAQLAAAGIATANIERLADCTRCRSDAYWTYRGGDRAAVLDGWSNVLSCTLLPS